MAVAPRCACQVLRASSTFTIGRGWHGTPSVTAASQNINYVGPTQSAGTDCTPISLPIVRGSGSVTLPFYNLPIRNHGNSLTMPNVLRPFRNTMPQTYVQPMSKLLFEVHPMNISTPAGVVVQLTPHARDSTGVRCVGPFLGGSRRYSSFAVDVTATAKNASTSGTVTGWIVGRLHLSSG